MYIPNPYFSNIPQMGDLVLDYIFVEDGYPILFVCKSDESYFLCVCRTLIPEQKWIVSEILFEDLKKLLKQEIDIHDAFISYKNGKSCIVKWNKGVSKEQYQVMPTLNLDFNEIPEKGIFLDEDEIGNYLERLENREIVKEEKNVQMRLDTDSYVIHYAGINVSYSKDSFYEQKDFYKTCSINTKKNVSLTIKNEVVNNGNFNDKKAEECLIKVCIAPAA